MEAEWSELLLRYQDQSGSLVPNISRTQIQKVSLRYLQAGKKPEELFYQPRFSFTKLQMEYTLGEMMTNVKGRATVKWLIDKYNGGNIELKKAARFLLEQEEKAAA